MTVSIFKKKSLNTVFLKAKKKIFQEHPSLYFYREGKKKYKLHNINLPRKFSINKYYRLTLDEPNDYILLKKIYSYFNTNKKIKLNTKNLSNFLKENPMLCSINKDVKQKKVNI